MIGLYRPGESWLHRLPPLSKLVGLVLFTTALVAAARPAAVAAGAAAVPAGFVAAGLSARDAVAQVRPARYVVAAVAAFQWWVDGWRGAVVTAGGLVVCVAAAGLVSSTTRVMDLMEALVRLLGPFRRVIDPDRVALLLALTVRSVPVVTEIVTQARQARAARGQEREWRTLLGAVVIRCLHRADALAEALAARGVDD